ncbi:MAG: TetR/AcrR family transcriptional regulator [Spirochaetia bacterium]|nr:TetR/AcrR family transcriptional regulator [Spirochaetia bacterium]
MPRISKEKREAVRTKILSVSKKLFLENGYFNTSTYLISQEVGVAEGTLFNYFDTKVDIFLASVLEHYFSTIDVDEYNLSSSGDVIDLMMEYINNKLSSILMLPKHVLIELATAIIGKATQKKDVVRELNLIDRQFIKKLNTFILLLEKDHRIKGANCSTLGEIIFSIVMMELFIYLNIHSYTKGELISRIREKISVLMVGYLE